VNNKVLSSFLAFAVLFASIFVFDVNAQKTKPKTTRATPKTKAPTDPLIAALPQSDMVISVNVNRLLNEFVPKVLAESPDKLGKLNEQLEKIKSQSGFDLRKMERVVAGIRFVRTAPSKVNIEAVALAKSAYNPEGIISGGKVISKGKFKEEKYAGKNIVIFDLSGVRDQAVEAVKGGGAEPTTDPNNAPAQTENKSMMDRIVDTILGGDLKEVAAVSIDDKTLAIGKLSSVKSMLDKKATVKPPNAAVNELALKNPTAVLSFGGNVPDNVSKLIDFDNEFAKQLDAIKQVYGSVGMSEANYEIALSARAINPTEAKNLFDVLQFLKQFGGGFLQGRNDELSKIGAGLLEGLKTKNEGKDVHLKIEMKQSDVNGLLKLF